MEKPKCPECNSAENVVHKYKDTYECTSCGIRFEKCEHERIKKNYPFGRKSTARKKCKDCKQVITNKDIEKKKMEKERKRREDERRMEERE